MLSTLISTKEAARCLEVFESACEPIVAADLAVMLYLSGSRETQRRKVRAIVEQLRKSGAMIIAANTSGYWLTEDPQLWADYLEGRQIEAKRILSDTYKKKKMLADGKGQGLLFSPGANAYCGIG